MMIIVLVLVSKGVFAQRSFYPENKLQLGVKGGLNLAHLFHGQLENRSSRLGVPYGVFAKVPIGTFFSLQPEVLFSPKGVNITHANPGSGISSFVVLDYIEVPIMIVLDLGRIVDVQGGLYTARTVREGVSPVSQGEQFRRYDFGFDAGFSFKFHPAVIGMRYAQGFVQVARNEEARLLVGNAVNFVVQFYVALILKN